MTKGPIALTMGDPAGIGTELCLRLFTQPDLPPLRLIGDPDLLATRAQELAHPALKQAARRAIAHLHPLPLTAPVTLGRADPAHAPHILAQLQIAARGCLSGSYRAMVTAPISKQVILQAGIPFTGQTEYLAQLCPRSPPPVMVLAAPDMRVALVTTHLPLAAVPVAVTPEKILKTLTILHRDLPTKLGARHPPHIAVCALNPHAGEGGLLGDEDQRIIAPTVAQARARGINATGPHAADTLLATATLPQTDCVLAMYHDQGLPAIKSRDLARTINITLGLPFLRTAPDHGTAYDIAPQGKADPTSLKTALHFAAASPFIAR